MLKKKSSMKSVKYNKKSSLKSQSLKSSVKCPITLNNINLNTAEVCKVNWNKGNRTLYSPGVLGKCKTLVRKVESNNKTGNIKIVYENSDTYKSPLTRRSFKSRDIKKYKKK